MIRIGITGQAGFIGTHLYNTISLDKDRFQLVPFADNFFDSEELLDAFVKQCDVIVHLAAMNRHNDPEVLYTTNVGLVTKLINSMQRTDSKPYVIMSSSLQEERDNLYGRSKREGRELFNKWADRTGASFTGMIIPNVFGPFGVPYYNSVISTFSYQIVNGEEPKIEVDAELKLIYVGDLVNRIIGLATENTENTEVKSNSNTDLTDQTDGHGLGFVTKNTEGTDMSLDNSVSHILHSTVNKVPRLIHVEHQAKFKVTELLSKLRGYHRDYVVGGVFPDLSNWFEVCLFNTFRSYLPESFFPVRYIEHRDPRGVYVEAMKCISGGQSAYSTTVPGITRGNHFHLRKIERFAVVKGKASIKLRKYGTDKVIEYIIDGNMPGYVDMPVWYTHNITNIGDDELFTMFWINEFYNPEDADTYFEEV
jgi:UDP-2-acetamido-2,6-beta-L-arabino-hexul-4-ose reductase